MTISFIIHVKFEQAHNEAGVFLTEIESKELFVQVGINVADTRLATSNLLIILRDNSLHTIPSTRRSAREKVIETGYRVTTKDRYIESVNVSKPEDVLLVISDFVTKNPSIEEFNINPVIACQDHNIATDTSVILSN